MAAYKYTLRFALAGAGAGAFALSRKAFASSGTVQLASTVVQPALPTTVLVHGLDSQRAAHPKTVEELQSELMALVDDALIHGTIMLTDSNCDLAHVWSCQSQSHGDASKTKKGLRERLRQKLNFGRKSTGACKVAERR